MGKVLFCVLLFIIVLLSATFYFQQQTIENSHSRQESIEGEQVILINAYYDSETIEQRKFAVERLEDMCFEYGKNKMLRQAQVILSNEDALCR
jgi:hypothetical protein